MSDIPDFLKDDDTGNWSAGKEYSHIKVMRWLYLLDNYQFMACFGSLDFEEELNTSEEYRTLCRVYGLKRLHKALDILISNTKKLMKPAYRETVEQMHEEIKELTGFIEKSHTIIRNEKSKQNITQINEPLFNKILIRLEDTKTNLLEPLNKSNLVFRGTDQTTPEQKKAKFTERMVNEG